MMPRRSMHLALALVVAAGLANAQPVKAPDWNALGDEAVTLLFTDCHFFREKGIPCYGFMPFKFNDRDLVTIHGNDERISVQNVKDGAQMMHEIVSKLAAE